MLGQDNNVNIKYELVEKLCYNPKYEVTREDEEIMPVCYLADEYRSLSMSDCISYPKC